MKRDAYIESEEFSVNAREAGISRDMDHLRKTIERVQMEADELAAALEPVLRLEPAPCGDAVADGPEGCCPLSKSLVDAAHAVNYCAIRLSGLRARLAL